MQLISTGALSMLCSGDHVGKWASTKEKVRASAKIPAKFSGGPFGWNDMDMLETGNYEQAAHANGKESNMTATEYHTEFAMWAISASPLVVTTPIMNCTVSAPRNATTCNGWISELQKAILLNTEVLAINQDVTPQGRPIRQGDLRVWARRLSDGARAVALYNEEDEEASIGVEMRDLGFEATDEVAVRDLWARADEGDFQGHYPPVKVPPHGTRLLRMAIKAPATLHRGGA